MQTLAKPGSGSHRRRRILFLVALVGLLAVPGPEPGVAQEEAVPTATATPKIIAVHEIAAQAESVKTFLREIEEQAFPSAAVEEFAKALPELRKRGSELAAESKASLTETPSFDTLSALQNRWKALQGELQQVDGVLSKRAEELETAMLQLDELQALWKLSRDEAKAAKAPETLLKRTQEVLSAIGKARQPLEQRRTRVLLLEDGVTTELSQCTAQLDRIAKGRRELVGRLSFRDHPPIWSRDRFSRVTVDLPARLRTRIESRLQAVYEHVAANSNRIAPHLLLSLLVLVLLLRAHAAVPHLKQEPEAAAAATVLELPFSSAIILSTLGALWLYPDPPIAFRLSMGLIYVLPLLRLLQRLIDAPFHLPLYGMIALFFSDRVRKLVADDALSQWWFVLEILAICVFIAWLARSGRLDIDVRNRSLRLLARPIFLALLFAGTAGAAGYLELAQFVSMSVVGIGLLALGLYAAVNVLIGLFTYELRAWPLNLSRLVRRNRQLLQRRGERILRTLALFAWVGGGLGLTGLLDLALDAVEWILGAAIEVGALHLSVGGVLAFALTIWVSFKLSSLTQFVLEEDVYPHWKLPRGVPYAVSRLTHYSILVLGFFLALATLGFDLTRFTIIAGAFGVGIGFGLQNVVNNFVSGLILLFERPVQVGDVVQIADVFGEIRRIGMRSSTIRTWEGAEVLVPNANLISDTVTNWTLSDRMRRIDLPVGVAYGTDPKRVQELLKTVAAEHPLVIADPEPRALFNGFGESSLDFQLRAWTSDFDNWIQIRSELAVAVCAALADAGITIPFPQRDVHFMPTRPMDVRVVGEAAGGKTHAAAQPRPSPATQTTAGKKDRDDTSGS
jgi:small-conductance mechanosensitive channel